MRSASCLDYVHTYVQAFIYHTRRPPIVEVSNELQGASYTVVVRFALRMAAVGRIASTKPTVLSRVEEVVMPVVQV